jgi:hypothetical protein
MKVKLVPVIQPGPAYRPRINRKTQRMNQVQARPGTDTGARHIPGVDMDFRFDQNDMHRRLPALFSGIVVPMTPE